MYLNGVLTPGERPEIKEIYGSYVAVWAAEQEIELGGLMPGLFDPLLVGAEVAEILENYCPFEPNVSVQRIVRMTVPNDRDSHSDASSDPALFAEWLARAQAGEQLAIAHLVDCYREYLLFIANSDMEPALKTKLGASDVVQQSMVAIYQQLPGFRGQTEAEFRGWIRKIVQNNVLNSRRNYRGVQRRQIGKETPLQDERNLAAGMVDPHQTPQAEALIRELSMELERCLTSLTPTYQQVLRMRNWQEMSFVEIAAAVDSTPDAVRKLWFRAFQKLQQTILASRPEFASHVSQLSRSWRQGGAEQ